MSIVQKIMLILAAYHRASWRTRRSHNVIPVPEKQQLPSGRLRLVGLWGKKTQRGGAQFLKKVRLEATEQLWVVQTGESFEQAKVFKSHAVPQGPCANLINVLKFLANQQEDGDAFLQNIVTNLGKGSRKGFTAGLREFMKVDIERALDVGARRRGTGTFKVRKPKAPEWGSDVMVRESPCELTLRAEEVNILSWEDGPSPG